MNWPVVDGSRNELEIQVPTTLLTPLLKSGLVESFQFYLTDRAELCCATLASNDHNQQFALFINCSAWLTIATLPEHFDCFARQLRLVTHHEMAHLRYKHGDLRIEQIAHCRGIASLISIETFPDTAGKCSENSKPIIPRYWQMPRFAPCSKSALLQLGVLFDAGAS